VSCRSRSSGSCRVPGSTPESGPTSASSDATRVWNGIQMPEIENVDARPLSHVGVPPGKFIVAMHGATGASCRYPSPKYESARSFCLPVKVFVWLPQQILAVVVAVRSSHQSMNVEFSG